jgi:hypothetical protein
MLENRALTNPHLSKDRHMNRRGNFSLVCLVYCLAFSAFLFSACATVFIATDNVTINGKPATIHASSELKPLKNDPDSDSLRHLYDNDSTTRWIEGSQLGGEGEWIDIKFQQPFKFRGMVLGMGVRKDYMNLQDYSVPLKIKVRIDEKPTMDYTIDWDTKADSRPALTREEVNMRKAFLWFNTDTAFTTASFQIKFVSVQNGMRYQKLAMSDVELLEENDKQFDLLNILKNVTINPNDLVLVTSPTILIGSDDPDRIKQAVENALGSSESSSGWKSDSSKIDQALNTGMHDITDRDQVKDLIVVLKRMFMQDGRVIRYIFYGRTMTYMMKVGPVFFGGNQWDIWRYISTTTTSTGIGVSIRYVPFAN